MSDNNGLLDGVLGALPIAGAVFNPIMQGVSNRKQRKWEEKMAQRQRDWAIEDWNRTNEYNNPKAQMQRLKDAGLNPNLVYGNGAEGNATGMPRATSSGQWTPKAPQFDADSVIGPYYNTQIQKAQVENLRANNQLIQANTSKAYADIILKGIQGETGAYNLKFKKSLENYYMDIVKYNSANAGEKNLMMKNQIAMQENYLNITYGKELAILDNKVKAGELSLQKALLDITGKELANAKSIEERKNLVAMREFIQSGTNLRDVQAQVAPVSAGSNVVSSLWSIIKEMVGNNNKGGKVGRRIR